MASNNISCYAKNVNNQNLVTKDGDYTKMESPEKALQSFVSNLIDTYMTLTREGYFVDFDKIPYSEKYKFAALLIPYYKDNPLTFLADFTGASLVEQTLIKLFNEDNLRTRENTISLLKTAVVCHYKNNMVEMIEEAMEDRQEAQYWKQGFRPVRCNDTGHIEWQRAGAF